MTGTLLMSVAIACAAEAPTRTYVVVDTGQTACYDTLREIPAPQPGEAFYGQDGQFNGPQPSYQDNGDGTVSDLNTGLMWQQDPGAKVTWAAAVAGAAACRTGGYTDWRLPTIKELYSLIDFRGVTGFGAQASRPYLDTRYFRFQYGDVTGERFIDSQYCSSTQYVSTTMGGNATVFGVNFADGRIKGYPSGPVGPGGRVKLFYCLYVRGNPEYGKNDLRDNGDGAITDEATGLMWQQADDGVGRTWQQALAYAEGLALAGHDDWRLPNVKELESLVDYTRSPRTSHSAAIDPLFQCTPITAEDGQPNYAAYWTSTTHLDGPGARAACYVCFGEALGFMFGRWIDVHGAGAQRSDPKIGTPLAFPQGRGPQGDAIRVYNLVRCARDAGD